MNEMTLDELLNVLWAVLEVNRGTPLLYETIEEELTKRIRLIKDEQFEVLMACFGVSQDESKETAHGLFTSRFLDLVIRVVKDKREKFSIRTLVHLIWSCSRLDFSSNNH
jgi:hypothetical protein